AAASSLRASSRRTQPPPPAPYSLSLHDALPIYQLQLLQLGFRLLARLLRHVRAADALFHLLEVRALLAFAELLLDRLHLLVQVRSEEHTSELQSRENLVCRLLLEKKKLQPGTLP